MTWIKEKQNLVIGLCFLFFFFLIPFNSSDYSAVEINTALAQTSPEDLQNNTIAVTEARTEEEREAAANRVAEQETFSSPVSTQNELGLSGMRLALYNIMTGFGSIFTLIGGWFLDVSIAVFTVNFAATATNTGLAAAVAALWTVIRDLFNLLFVFGLIWIGFQTILDIGGADTKRTLGYIIAAALLINFSLYIAQVVVDFTSIASYQISQLMSSPYKQEENILGIEVPGIADVFVDMTDVENFPKNSQTAADQIGGEKDSSGGYDTWGAAFLLGFVVMIVLIIMGFVFAAGAVILFTRFIALIILMIFSPIMFLGWVLPSFKSKSKEWWKYFFNQALVGPAYLFMLYLALRALQQMSTMKPAEVTLYTMLLYFMIVTGFVWAALMVARQLGSFGANQAINIGQSLRKKAQSLAGAYSVGFASNAALQGYNRFQSSNFAQSRAGRALRVAANVATLGATTDKSVRGALNAGTRAKFGGSGSFSSYTAENTARSRELQGIRGERERENNIRSTTNALQNNPNGVTGDQMRDFTNSIRNLSNAQLTENLSFDTLTNQNVAINLTDSQIESLRDSGRFTDQQIGDIRRSREQGFTNIASGNTGPNNVANAHRNAEWLGTRSTQQMAQMPASVFAQPQMAPYLTPAVVEARLREGGMTDQEVIDIRDNIENYLFGPNSTPDLISTWRDWSGRSFFSNRLGLRIP